ncbi:MAG TPA: hypothetical protein VHC71_13855 [Hyphomicrobium sp.]|jgi:hypothetical protein|nr:hypothetical protein [Hyphomicrobium sp.]
MLIGTYLCRSSIDELVSGNGVEYDDKSNTFREKRWVQLTGKIERKRMGHALVIGDKKTWADSLPISVNLASGEPIILENAAEEQTKLTHAGPKPAFIQQCLGWIWFAPAWSDKELGANEPDSLYAELRIRDAVFNDIWSWARFGRDRVGSMSIAVFGKHMQDDPKCGWSSEYQWDVGDRAAQSLLVSEFSFSISSEKSGPKTGNGNTK